MIKLKIIFFQQLHLSLPMTNFIMEAFAKFITIMLVIILFITTIIAIIMVFIIVIIQVFKFIIVS
jgi:hypothetical protein